MTKQRVEVESVTAVLLADGEWYEVLITDGRSSFDVVKYDFLRAKSAVFGDMRASDGFVFTDPEGRLFQGPLTAVLAIRSQG
jgi:hypothetical protein